MKPSRVTVAPRSARPPAELVRQVTRRLILPAVLEQAGLQAESAESTP